MHAVDEIEPMRVEALHPGVQLQMAAAFRARPGRQPVEQRLTVALRPGSGVSDEIVDIEDAPAEEVFDHAEARHRANPALVLEDGERKAGGDLPPNSLDERGCLEVRTQ